jgi:hypothetical protein
MGAMLVCWVLFPAVLGALSLGCGLALERAAATRLPAALLMPAGFAVLIAVAGVAVAVAPVAKLATPLVVAVAVLGLVIGRLPKDRRLGAPLALAVVVLVIYGAPVLLTGQATFLGFNRLDDTSTWLGITDWVMSHGRDLSGLAPSTYETMLKNYVATGYPLGAFLPVGIGHLLTGQDVAWLFQPAVSFIGAMLGLSLYALVEPLVRSPVRRGIVAAIGAQPALLIGYAWWGSIKELAAAALVALAAALAALLMRAWPGLRGLLPLGVTVAAFAGVYSAGGVAWLAPVVLPALAALAYRYRRTLADGLRRSWVLAVLAVGVEVLLFLPALSTLTKFAAPSGAQFATTSDLGVLTRPLSALQGFGIWPSGDLRSATVNATATDLLLVVVILAALTGVALAWRSRGWGVLLYAFASLASGAIVFLLAGPWVAAKALAIASPAAIFCALAAAMIGYERGRRLEAAAVAIVVAGGVLWSNVLQYHAVTIAPRDQLSELQHIGTLIAGQGPTLLAGPDHYGARHFLRAADPESLADIRSRLILLRSGAVTPLGTAQDLDAVNLTSVLVYRSLVLRTSPVSSRPPSPYRLIWQGRFYEVWQRTPNSSQVISHLSLGNPDDPAATPACRQILELAHTAGARRLAYVLRDSVIRIALADLTLPPGWTPSGQSSDIAYLGPAGQVTAAVSVTRAGDYRAWVGNSFRSRLELLVDGHPVGSGRQDLNVAGAYTPFGSIALAAGRHLVTLRYSGPDWHPGSGGAPEPTGPVVLSDQTADRPVMLAGLASARALCARRLDWVEALG